MKYLLYLCCLIHLPLPILAIHKQADPFLGALGPREAAARSARCTNLDPSVVESFERQFAADKQTHAQNLRRAVDTNSSQPIGTMKRRQMPLAPITVHFHVISGDQSPQNGNVPDEQIQSQIKVINEAFASTGLSFVLGGIDRTVDNDWFSNGGPDTNQQIAMKARLRSGGRADLNIYTVNFNGKWSGLLGYSTFPQQSKLKDDGVVILFSSLPGGEMTGYDQGKTAVHEIGHWVGLYHTFQGGCSGSGDYVPDTPPEAIPSEGCIEGRSTCLVPDLLQGETDPIHNYMDYSPDSCMTEFTPGQADRAKAQFELYRINDY
ncbi:hypothetical protein H1R20_g11708, partial [Candolleomyces eurysporus]